MRETMYYSIELKTIYMTSNSMSKNVFSYLRRYYNNRDDTWALMICIESNLTHTEIWMEIPYLTTPLEIVSISLLHISIGMFYQKCFCKNSLYIFCKIRVTLLILIPLFCIHIICFFIQLLDLMTYKIVK